MDIKKSLDSVLAQIEADKKEASETLVKAQKMMQEAKIEAAGLAMMRDSLEGEKEVLKDYRKTKELVDSMSDVEKELAGMKTEALEKHNELVVWENKLVEISAIQERKEKELKEKEDALNKEKTEYKERIRKEFFSELSQKMA